MTPPLDYDLLIKLAERQHVDMASYVRADGETTRQGTALKRKNRVEDSGRTNQVVMAPVKGTMKAGRRVGLLAKKVGGSARRDPLQPHFDLDGKLHVPAAASGETGLPPESA